MLDLDDDGKPEVLVFAMPAGNGVAFKSDGGGWQEYGTIQNGSCRGVRDALRAGDFRTVAPTVKEIDVAGQRLRIASSCQ